VLKSGSRLGQYEIVSALGVGGMGEVYRAHDPKLNRGVAIKVLPEVANDPDRLARFSREAQVLASLNHPNIAAIYGLEDSGDARALALDTNQASASADNSPTITSPAAMTAHGVILGTAAYMAPEQARGRVVDKRADIWAFGCVLFEMLTDERAFKGEDLAETISSVMKSAPAWEALPRDVPLPVVRYCTAVSKKMPARASHRSRSHATYCQASRSRPVPIFQNRALPVGQHGTSALVRRSWRSPC